MSTDNLILIAEDDRDVRDLLTYAVEMAGYRAVGVRDGRAAAQLFATARPVALITDVRMPAMNGMELSRFVRSDPENWNTAILMVSAGVHAYDVDAGLSSGADRYLSKPFTPKRVLAALREILVARGDQPVPAAAAALPAAFRPAAPVS